MPPPLTLDDTALPRRGFLRLLLALSAVLPAGVLLAVPVEKAERRISLRALGPYLNTLIPEDMTPSATQLGVDKAIIDLVRKSSRIARLVGLGCAWLDEGASERGAKEFAALDEAGQEAVVTLAAQSAPGSLSRAFFDFTQRQAFSHYYAQPAAWEGFGFAGPPQPLGFLDQADPPRVSAQ